MNFWTHKDLLCSSSQFFKNALANKLKDETDDGVELPDDSEEAVDIFIKGLYTARIELDMPTEPITSAVKIPYWRALVEAYILAHRLAIFRLKNDIIDRILESTQTLATIPWNGVVHTVDARLPEGTPLRSLCLHLALDRADAPWYDSEWNRTLLRETPAVTIEDALLLRTKVVAPGAVLQRPERCGYHSHSAAGTPGLESECAGVKQTLSLPVPIIKPAVKPKGKAPAKTPKPAKKRTAVEK